MKDSSTRQAWRIGLVAALLPMALGSAAQGGLKWQGTATPSPAIAQAAPSGIPAATPPLDVRNFEAIAQQLVAGGRIPGLAVAIVQNGRVLSARGYGVTDARNGEPVDAHTVFRLASLSKSFAGTVTGIPVLPADAPLPADLDQMLISGKKGQRLAAVAAPRWRNQPVAVAARYGEVRDALWRGLDARA